MFLNGIYDSFNKREDDFDCLEEYNLYLEKIESLSMTPDFLLIL